MEDRVTGKPSSQASQPSAGAGSLPITPELVQQVADRVYQMFRETLAIERERRGWQPGTSHWRSPR